MTQAPLTKEAVEREIRLLENNASDCHVRTETVALLRALSARVEELETALHPEMAELLYEMGAEKCQLTIDEHYGWHCGLRAPMNQPPQSDDDWMIVANLDVEDGQFGPRLWDYAISVLKSVKSLKEPQQ